MSGERDDDATTIEGSGGAKARPSGKRSGRSGERRSGRTASESANGVATLNRPTKTEAGRTERTGRGNPFKKLARFFREVVAELRKVIWPNRKQMIGYTSVVLVFVTFMVAFISGLDVGFIKAVGWLFG